jgi:hypothetical protein
MNPLLTYSITTNPFPLQASASGGNPNIAQMTIVATNNSGSDVTLQGMMVQIPIGQLSTQLTNDSADIGPVAPANWQKPQVQTPTGYVQCTYLPQPGYGTVKAGESVNFVFNDIQVNSQTGQVEIDVTEGSNNCTPGNCPVQLLYITKFPNSWGQVSFWVDSPVIPLGGNITLHWSGPAGATYSIQYYDPRTGIVNIPSQGQPPLGSQGQYPAQGAPPLTPQQTTIFTLNVTETISGQSYAAQTQLTVTVEISPPLINSFAAVPSNMDMNSPQKAQLTWNTSNVSLIKIDGVGSFTGPQAANGSTTIAPVRTTRYFATAYGNQGYSGPPKPANTWLNFVGTADSDFLNVWGSAGNIWSLSLGQGRNVFTLNLQVNGDGTPGKEQDFSVYLNLQQGVQVADLGGARGGAGYDAVINASYGTGVPMSQVWSGYCFNLSDDIFGENPVNVGATWGVKFSDGLLALLWLDNVYPNGDYYGTHLWAFTFKWIFYNQQSLAADKKKKT